MMKRCSYKSRYQSQWVEIDHVECIAMVSNTYQMVVSFAHSHFDSCFDICPDTNTHDDDNDKQNAKASPMTRVRFLFHSHTFSLSLCRSHSTACFNADKR